MALKVNPLNEESMSRHVGEDREDRKAVKKENVLIKTFICWCIFPALNLRPEQYLLTMRIWIAIGLEHPSFKVSAEAGELWGGSWIGMRAWLDCRGSTHLFTICLRPLWISLCRTSWDSCFLIMKRWSWGLVGGPLSSGGCVRWDRAFERAYDVTATLPPASPLAYQFLEHRGYFVDFCVPQAILNILRNKVLKEFLLSNRNLQKDHGKS